MKLLKWNDYLAQKIKEDPQSAVGYLQAVIDESKDCEPEEAKKLIRLALKHIEQGLCS